jgi:hypothetical protein
MRSKLVFHSLFVLGLGLSGCESLTFLTDHPGLPPGDTPTSDMVLHGAGSAANLRQNVSTFEDVVGSEPILYRLGSLSAGDHLSITIQPSADAVSGPWVCLFNSDREALVVDQRLAKGLNQRQAIIEYQVRAADEYFVGLAPAPGVTAPCPYVGSVRYELNSAAPQRSPQTLVLNFNGGNVRIGATQYNIALFDASTIDSAFADQTDLIKSYVIQNVRAAFAGKAIRVTTSDDPGVADSPHSTVYFGGSSPSYLGISQNIDYGNVYCCDSAVVFTDHMSRGFLYRPSAYEMGALIANVTCHETGHLLGLNHTVNPLDFMDITRNQRDLLKLRSFTISSLNDDVFPMGLQNGPALLELNLAGQ